MQLAMQRLRTPSQLKTFVRQLAEADHDLLAWRERYDVCTAFYSILTNVGHLCSRCCQFCCQFCWLQTSAAAASWCWLTHTSHACRARSRLQSLCVSITCVGTVCARLPVRQRCWTPTTKPGGGWPRRCSGPGAWTSTQMGTSCLQRASRGSSRGHQQQRRCARRLSPRCAPFAFSCRCVYVGVCVWQL